MKKYVSLFILALLLFTNTAFAGSTFTTSKEIRIYSDSIKAYQQTNSIGKYAPGTYEIFSTASNGMLNITKYAGSPGAWINPKEAQVTQPAASPVYKITNHSVNFRTGPATSYSIIRNLAAGTKVQFLGRSGNWSKIIHNGTTGYVSSKYLASLTSYQKLITKSRVNFRKGPGSSYLSLGKLAAGTQVENLGKYKDVWAKVRYRGTIGYIHSKYLNALAPYYKAGILVVNKNYPLPSSYVPGSRDDAAQAAMTKLRKAYYSQTGRRIYVSSGYRSYSLQRDLFNRYVARSGYAAAKMYSARPSYSEHQSGLAFDVNGSNPDTNIKSSFQYTKEYSWLRANAHKYGFILRYPKGKTSITGYIFEPWHYRYVGVTAASKIKAANTTLEEYLNLP